MARQEREPKLPFLGTTGRGCREPMERYADDLLRASCAVRNVASIQGVESFELEAVGAKILGEDGWIRLFHTAQKKRRYPASDELTLDTLSCRC